MFKILHHQGNTNQTTLIFHLTPVRLTKVKKKTKKNNNNNKKNPQVTDAGNDVNEEHSSIVGEIVIW